MAVLTLGEDGLISICADIFPSPCEQWPHDTHRHRAGGPRAALSERICQAGGWELPETGNVPWSSLKKLIIIQHLHDWAIKLISTPHTQALLSSGFWKKAVSALLHWHRAALSSAPKRQLRKLQCKVGGKQDHKGCAQFQSKMITKRSIQVTAALSTPVLL